MVLSPGQWVYVPPLGRRGNVVRALYVAGREFYQVLLAADRKRDTEFVVARSSEIEVL